MSRDVEIRKQRHGSLMFAEFPNQSPSTNYDVRVKREQKLEI